MQPIALVTCKDCGDSVVLEKSYISIFKLGNELTAIAVCPYCSEPVSQTITKKDAKRMADKGVSIFDWRQGRAIQRFNYAE